MRYLFYVSFFVIGTSSLWSQTGGPSQPEFTQFKSIGNSGLVETSTGNFSYQVDLLSIGGYPINLTYSSGVGMEDVASQVGLGWAINTGSINRSLRGIPDDFKGDVVTNIVNFRPNKTIGETIGLSAQFFNLPLTSSSDPTDTTGSLSLGASANFGLTHNTYRGWDITFGINPSLSLARYAGGQATLGLGYSASSQNGVDVHATGGLSMSKRFNTQRGEAVGGLNLGYTMSVNSLQGLKTSLNVYGPSKISDKNASASILDQLSVSFGIPTQIPNVNFPFTTTGFSGKFSLGGELFGLHPGAFLSIHTQTQGLC